MERAWPGRGLSVALEWAGGGARIQRRGPACDLRGEAQITHISHAKWAVSALPRCAVGSCEDFSERLFEPPLQVRFEAGHHAERLAQACAFSVAAASLLAAKLLSTLVAHERRHAEGRPTTSRSSAACSSTSGSGTTTLSPQRESRASSATSCVLGLPRGSAPWKIGRRTFRGRTRCSGGRAQPDRHRPGAGRATRRHRRAPAVTSATVMSSQVMPVGWWDGYGWQAATPIPPPETPFRTSEVVDQAMLLPVSGGGVKGPRGNCAASVPPVRDQTTEVEGGE